MDVSFWKGTSVYRRSHEDKRLLHQKREEIMGKLIAEIEGTGPGNKLRLSIMNNDSLGLTIENETIHGKVPYSIFIKKEKVYPLLEALKEYYREAHNGQLPLWW